MKILDRLFNKKDPVTDNNINTIEDDDKLYVKTIYNGKNNFILLISYSIDYVFEMTDFIIACTNAKLTVKFVDSSYDEDVSPEEPDIEELEDIEVGVIRPILPEKITHQRHYIITSGRPDKYGNLVSYLEYINNPILQECILEFHNHLSSSYFKDHAEYLPMHFNEGYFKYKKVAPVWDKQIKIGDVLCDDIPSIIKQLPENIPTRDIFDIIIIDLPDNYPNLKSYILSLYKNNYVDYSVFLYEIKSIFPNLDWDNIIVYLNQPRYMIANDSLEDGLNDIEIDGVFKEKYESLTPLIDDPNYELVDDKYSDDQIREYIDNLKNDGAE